MGLIFCPIPTTNNPSYSNRKWCFNDI